MGYSLLIILLYTIIHRYSLMYIVLFHSGLQHVSKTHKTKQSHLNRSNGETSKKVDFINNIDRTQVAELNILLDNSQNRTLDQNQINIFAAKMEHIFQKSAKQSFKTYAVVSKKVKTLNLGLVYNATKPQKGTILHEKIMLFTKAKLQNA